MARVVRLARLADRDARVPTLVATAHSRARGDQAVLGAKAVIVKPFTCELIAMVRQLTS